VLGGRQHWVGFSQSHQLPGGITLLYQNSTTADSLQDTSKSPDSGFQQPPTGSNRGAEHTKTSKQKSILLTGCDTLAVGFKIGDPDPGDSWQTYDPQSGFYLTQEEWVKLADAKVAAQGKMFESGGCPVELRGQTFSVSSKGSRGYEFVFVNSDLTIQLATESRGGKYFPEVRITFRSQYLWRFGWQACYARVRKWLDTWANVVGNQVSRVDLNIDLALELPEINLRGGEVVTPARDKTEYLLPLERHLVGLVETGFTFGKGDLMARIYNKRVEIQNSNKVWFEDLWRRNGWDGVSPVTRTEFQLRRGALKQLQVESVEDLGRQMGDLMKYLTVKWLRLTDKNPSDTNRARWPLKTFWFRVVQAGMNFGPITGVVRLAQRLPHLASLRSLVEGVLVSITALLVDNPDGGTAQEQGVQVRGLIEGVLNGEFSEKVRFRSAKFATMLGD